MRKNEKLQDFAQTDLVLLFTSRAEKLPLIEDLVLTRVTFALLQNVQRPEELLVLHPA